MPNADLIRMMTEQVKKNGPKRGILGWEYQPKAKGGSIAALPFPRLRDIG